MSSVFPPLVQAMLSPDFYPHRPPEVELRQTHISYVFLAGAQVYKVKKPVDFGFLDFTSLEKRRVCCQRELDLNRRLCPDIYRAVVGIFRTDAGFSLSPSGAEVETAVLMERMDETRMMQRLLAQGAVGTQDIDRIVETLVPFYRHAECGPAVARYGESEAVAQNVLENFAQTEAFIGSPGLAESRFHRLRRYAVSFLAGREVFARRIGDGRIRDCHGDLYSANICLEGRVHIFDCIEFNDRFRYADAASDIAFLAMDLDYHGREDLSRHLVEKYRLLAQDDDMESVLDFYKSYRAYVRGKIALLTAQSPEVDVVVREDSLAAAARYFDLAERYAGI